MLVMFGVLGAALIVWVGGGDRLAGFSPWRRLSVQDCLVEQRREVVAR